MRGKVGLPSAIEHGSIDIAHVEYEVEMQFHRYQQLIVDKHRPTHVDGHQHIHVHPMLADIIARQAHRFDVKYILTPLDRSVFAMPNPNPFYLFHRFDYQGLSINIR